MTKAGQGSARDAGHRSLAVLLAISLAAAGATSAPASLWNMEGLGGWVYGYDQAARAAGGTAIGVIDPFGMSPINPAQSAWATLPQAHFGYTSQRITTEASGSGSSDVSGASGVTGARVVIPLPGTLRFAAGFRSLTDGACDARLAVNPERGDGFIRQIEGTGGLNELSLGISGTLLERRAAAGVRFGLANGSLREVIEDDFVAGEFLDTRMVLRTRMENGLTWAAGVQGRPGPRLALGLYAAGGGTLDLKGQATEGTHRRYDRRAEVDIPEEFGAGLSWLATPRLRLAADWSRVGWGDVDITLKGVTRAGEERAPTRFVDTGRYGVGLTWLPGEVSPRDPLLRRSVLRAGFSLDDYYTPQMDGSVPHAWTASVGLGLPVQVDRGFLDLMLSYGRAGSLTDTGLEEASLTFGIGLTFGRLTSDY